MCTGVISATCPWFFEMRDLIAERPNMVPVGLGNSTTDIDPSILDPSLDNGTDDEDKANNDNEGGATMPAGGKEVDNEVEVIDGPGDAETKRKRSTLDESFSDSDDDLKPLPASLSNRTSTTVTTPATPASKPSGGKTKTRANATPSTAPADVKPDIKTDNSKSKDKKDAKKDVKRSKIGEFAELAQAEEVTLQERIGLAKLKVQSEREGRDKKSDYAMRRMELKAMKYKMKADLQKRKMDNEKDVELSKIQHEARIAELRLQAKPSPDWNTNGICLCSLFLCLTFAYSKSQLFSTTAMGVGTVLDLGTTVWV